jgi:hypothetical protein
MKFKFHFLFLGILLFLARGVRAQEVPYCTLAQDPASFDGKMIRVRGTLSVHFEDFTLVDKNCKTNQGIWLEFGGDVPEREASTVDESFRKRGLEIHVNGLSNKLKKDDNFERLYALISARLVNSPSYTVTATLLGYFAAGTKTTWANGQSGFSGYGHLGCCSLLVISEVSSDIVSVPPANLSLRGRVVAPDGKPLKGFHIFDDINFLFRSHPERQETVTDDSGNFVFSISGQLLRFETSKYRPVAIPVNPGGSPIRLKLEDASRSDWIIPSCGQTGTAARVGFSVLFALPSGMDASLMDDEFLHAYFLFPKGGNPSLADLIISTSATEQPEDISALDSSWSEQRWIKDSKGTIIGIDAKGSRRQGGLWRSAQFFGRDQIGYGWLRGTPTRPLDSVIDSACLARQ